MPIRSDLHRMLVAIIATGVLGSGCHENAQAPAPTAASFVSRDSVRLTYWTVGAGPDTVIVVHGGSAHHGYLVAPLTSRFGKGRTLIYYDQRGRGRSGFVSDSSKITFAKDVEDLEDLRQHLTISRFGLVGHHWGAVIAARYAHDFPDRVTRMALISPFPVIYSYFYELAAVDGDSLAFDRLLRDAGRPMTPDSAVAICRDAWPLFFSPLHPDRETPYRQMSQAMCDLPPDRIIDARRITRLLQGDLGQWVFRPMLETTRTQALVIEGGGEPLVEEAATRWAQHLANARVLLLPRPYLFPWVSDPKGFDRALDAFFEERWPAGSRKPDPWQPKQAVR